MKEYQKHIDCFLEKIAVEREARMSKAVALHLSLRKSVVSSVVEEELLMFKNAYEKAVCDSFICLEKEDDSNFFSKFKYAHIDIFKAKLLDSVCKFSFSNPNKRSIGVLSAASSIQDGFLCDGTDDMFSDIRGLFYKLLDKEITPFNIAYSILGVNWDVCEKNRDLYEECKASTKKLVTEGFLETIYIVGKFFIV